MNDERSEAHEREHDRLRLSPEDAALLWGIVDDFLARNRGRERWPRLERIQFDLNVMLAKLERGNG